MFILIARWMVSALALYIVSSVVSGIHLENFSSALVAVVVIGLVNALIKPVLFLLTLPITFLTLGIFSFVLNALMLLLAGSITPGFRIDGFGTALIGSVLLSFVTAILHSFIR